MILNIHTKKTSHNSEDEKTEIPKNALIHLN